MELEKENRNPLVPDPRERVLSAPPSLGHPRSNVKYRQVPRPQDEAPADHSYRRRAVPGHERHIDGGASAHYRVSRPPSSRYSLHSRGHDVSALRERQDQDFNTEQDVFSGRGSNSSYYPPSNYDINSERSSCAADSFKTDSFLSATRRTIAQSSFHEPHISHSQIQGTEGREQRFSLHSDIEREAQSRGCQMFPDGDDVMAFRRGRLEQGVQRYKECTYGAVAILQHFFSHLSNDFPNTSAIQIANNRTPTLL